MWSTGEASRNRQIMWHYSRTIEKVAEAAGRGVPARMMLEAAARPRVRVGVSRALQSARSSGRKGLAEHLTNGMPDAPRCGSHSTWSEPACAREMGGLELVVLRGPTACDVSQGSRANPDLKD